MVYNVEPYRAGVRKGNWKLVWTTLLRPRIELFDLSNDPSESTNLADQNPDKVKELQAWVIDLAKQAAPPLFLLELVRLGLSHEPQFARRDLRLSLASLLAPAITSTGSEPPP